MSLSKLTTKQTIRLLQSLLAVALVSLVVLSAQFYENTVTPTLPHDTNIMYDVCFTPNPKCLSLIVKQIETAKTSILVQAYSFTDPLIGQALVNAKQRGVSVKILLDKSNKKGKYSQISFMKKAQIPTLIDPCSGIAHNKVMIIDAQTVITGSYNFSHNAYARNAENVLVIYNEEIAKKYAHNWKTRWEMSQK